MFKMINLFDWVTTLVESFTFYGGGKGGGGSSSSSQPVDFFGKDKREPYEQMLGQLLGIYPMGTGTAPVTNNQNTNYNSQGQWVTESNGFGLTKQVWKPLNNRGRNRNQTPVETGFPGQQGGSILDFISSQPGFQFGMDRGQDALERRFSATGAGPSGAENIALAGYGQQYAGDYYQKMISNLMGPSGAGLVGNSSQSSSTGASPIPGALGTLAGAAFSAPAAAAAAPAFASTAFWLGSDKNLKTNIKHINTINGIKIYSFNYIWSYIKSIGVMAQDLLEMPQYKNAVHMTSIGYVVDYSKLPI